MHRVNVYAKYVVLVTGIGRATVEAFLREDAALVVAVDINAEKLNELTSDRKYRLFLSICGQVLHYVWNESS